MIYFKVNPEHRLRLTPHSNATPPEFAVWQTGTLTLTSRRRQTGRMDFYLPTVSSQTKWKRKVSALFLSFVRGTFDKQSANGIGIGIEFLS